MLQSTLVDRIKQRKTHVMTIQSLFIVPIKERRLAESELSLHVSLEDDLGKGPLLLDEACTPAIEYSGMLNMIHPRCLPSETEPG